MPAVAVEKAEAVLAADPNVVAAWAFGSAKDGFVGPDSDLDIGVFFRRKPGLDDLTDLLLKLQGALQFGDIDLVVLNGASSLLRFEAVSGRPIYCRDASERAAFVSLAGANTRTTWPSSSGACAGGPKRVGRVFARGSWMQTPAGSGRLATWMQSCGRSTAFRKTQGRRLDEPPR